MDFLSISLTMVVFSLFVFLWITFFYIRNRSEDKKLVLLLPSSLFMFVSLLSFHIEFLNSQNDSIYTHIFSFFSYSCMLYSVFSVVIMISELYHGGQTFKRRDLILYSIFSGVVFAFNNVYGTYAISFFILLALMGYPMYILGKALFQSKVNLWTSPFAYQIALIGILYLFKLVNLINKPYISETNADVYDSSYSMLILIVLIMFNVTYLLEYNHILNEDLKEKSTMLSKMLNKVKTESETDTLTRIANRAKLNAVLDVYYQGHKEYGNHFSIALIDVNNFKLVNDLYGHLMGDKVLTSIAENLRKVIRKDDIVGRWGGDEFIIIFPNTTIDHTEIISKNIRRGFESLEFSFEEDIVSISIGFANSSETKTIHGLIDLADERMYKEKDYYKESLLQTDAINEN